MGAAIEACFGDDTPAAESPARRSRAATEAAAKKASLSGAEEVRGGYFGLGLFPTSEEKAQRAKREINIKYKLREFVAKERRYIEHLGTVKREWIAPLRELERDPLVPAATRDEAARVVAEVFGGWTNLLDLHLQCIDDLELALLAAGRSDDAEAGGDARFRVAAPTAGRGAGAAPRADGTAWGFGDAPAAYVKDGTAFAEPLAGVFRTMGPYLKLYVPYCSLYATQVEGEGSVVLAADRVLEEACARGGPLAQQLKDAAARAAPLPLASLRIAPVQHVCRYRLVLGDLHRKMRRHDDAVAYDALKETILNLEGKLADVNAAANRAEETKLLREWERWSPGRRGLLSRGRGDSSSSLFGPTRRLLCHGDLHLAPPFGLSRPAPDANHGTPFAAGSFGESDIAGFWLAPDGGRIIDPHCATRPLNSHPYTAILMSNPTELFLFRAASKGNTRRRSQSALSLLQTGRFQKSDERVEILLATPPTARRGERAAIDEDVAIAFAAPSAVDDDGTGKLRVALDGSDRFLAPQGDSTLASEPACPPDRAFVVPALLLAAPTSSSLSSLSSASSTSTKASSGGAAGTKVLCASWLLKKERGKTTWVWQYFRLVVDGATGATGAAKVGAAKGSAGSNSKAARIEYYAHPWSPSTFGRSKGSGSIPLTLASAPAGVSHGSGASRIGALAEKEEEEKEDVRTLVRLGMSPTKGGAQRHPHVDGPDAWARLSITPTRSRPKEMRLFYAPSNAVAARWAHALGSCGAEGTGCAVRVGWSCFEGCALPIGGWRGVREGYRIKNWRGIGETIEGLQAQALRADPPNAALVVDNAEGGDAVFFDGTPTALGVRRVRHLDHDLWLAPSARAPLKPLDSQISPLDVCSCTSAETAILVEGGLKMRIKWADALLRGGLDLAES